MDESFTDIVSQRAMALNSLAATVDNTHSPKAKQALLAMMDKIVDTIITPKEKPTAQIIPFPKDN